MNSRNIEWQRGKVTAARRQKLFGTRAYTVWFTGLSGSGKSTLAFELEDKLFELGHACYVLDGDNVRHGLNRDLGFSPEDRTENIRRIAEVAHLFNDSGMIVIAAFISPYARDRALARQIVGEDRFAEVHLTTSIEVCEERDPKGLYAKARAGTLADFTGISAPYESPVHPYMSLDTGVRSLDECVQVLLDRLMGDFG